MSRVPPPLPVVLDLAPLPRLQVGPFLILGVDKDAQREAIEAAWAQRLIWARKNLTKTPLEDINWAREILNDSERRLRADAASLNIDTTDGVLQRLKEQFQGKDNPAGPGLLLDVEKNLASYEPPAPAFDLEDIRQLIPLPQIPREVPPVQAILEQFAAEPIDAWTFILE